MVVNAANFPDQPAPDEHDAHQLPDGQSPGRKVEDLPDGGDDDLGEDEAPPE